MHLSLIQRCPSAPSPQVRTRRRCSTILSRPRPPQTPRAAPPRPPRSSTCTCWRRLSSSPLGPPRGAPCGRLAPSPRAIRRHRPPCASWQARGVLRRPFPPPAKPFACRDDGSSCSRTPSNSRVSSKADQVRSGHTTSRVSR